MKNRKNHIPFELERPPLEGLPNPTHIWIEPTTRCNTRCIHCRHYYETFGQDMPSSLYNKISEQAMDRAEIVDLIGYGEPLMAPSFESILEDCSRRGIDVTTTTNGILLKKPELRERIVRAGIRLSLSLDGARAETFEFVRPYISWKDMVSVLENIRSRAAAHPDSGFRLRIVFVAMKRNIGDLPEMVRLAAKYGAGDVFVLPLGGEEYLEKVKGESLSDAPDLVSPAFLEALDLARKLRVNLTIPPSFLELILEGPERGMGFRGKATRASRKIRLAVNYLRKKGLLRLFGKVFQGTGPRTITGSAPCLMPWRDAYFSANGDVLPCCVGKPLGNIENRDWDSVWNGPMYQNLRRTIHGWNPTAMCRYCSYVLGINGGDERRFVRYFSKFQRDVVPLDSGQLGFEKGFYNLESNEEGEPSHVWMSGKGVLSMPCHPVARFLRLRIFPHPFAPNVTPGQARINGGPPEYFDDTCEEINLPIKKGSSPIRLEIKMETEHKAPGDPRPLGLPICGVEILR